MTPLSQVNGGMLEVILVQKPAESALLSENAKKLHLENSTFGLFLQITLQLSDPWLSDLLVTEENHHYRKEREKDTKFGRQKYWVCAYGDKCWMKNY